MAEKHGGSTLEITTNVAKFFPPWTVTRDVWLAALRPDVSGVAVDALLFHEAGRRLVHRYRVYKDPFPHPALRDGVIPRLLSCVVRAMAIARLTHLRISFPSSGSGAAGVFPGEDGSRPAVSLPHVVCVILEAEDTPEDTQSVPPLILPVVVEETEVLILETGVPPLTLPVVEDIYYDTPASEMVPMMTTPPESSLPPPPRFAPFVFPENDVGMDLEDLCTLFIGDSSLTLSPMSRLPSSSVAAACRLHHFGSGGYAGGYTVGSATDLAGGGGGDGGPYFGNRGATTDPAGGGGHIL